MEEDTHPLVYLTWEQVKQEFPEPARIFESTFDPQDLHDEHYGPEGYSYWLQRDEGWSADAPDQPGYLPTHPGYTLFAQAPIQPLIWNGEMWG